MNALATEQQSSPVLAQGAAHPPTPHAQRVEELGKIVLAYSELTDRLQKSHDQLQRQVAGLRTELGEKNRLLERKNRLAALGEMAAGLAHEIRNPLGGIQLYAGLLKQDLTDRPEALSVVEKITRGVKRLDALVNQVLQFSRELRTSIRPCDLAEIVAQAVELAQPPAEAANVTLRVEGPGECPANVDPVLFGQAVLNLVLNGIEAHESGGEVRVTFAPLTGRQLTLTVQDTGPGIAADALDRIFNPFFTTKDHGTGLGLSIVHRIVEAHDGTITAANAPQGGARFEIRV
jgi:signal transduction histidine kinase